jgi:hypothetical protein
MNTTPESKGTGNEQECCVSSLRCQLNTVLLLLFIVSGTFSVYLYRQASMGRKDSVQANEMVQKMQPLIAEYNRTAVPMLQDFHKRLQEFAKSHPDVTPILVKYGVMQNGAAPAGNGAPKK